MSNTAEMKTLLAAEQLIATITEVTNSHRMIINTLSENERETLPYMLKCLNQSLRTMMNSESYQRAREIARRIAPEIPFP